ncbi:MAG: hypothetical protein Q7S05_02630 [bacterium]|nr:hypothetical protein [bacterium]
MPLTILGLPYGVFLLLVSATFYFISSILILRPLFETKEQLIQSFFAWLFGMGLLHFFLAAGFFWDVNALLYIGMFGALTGSAYLLRIPLRGLWPRHETVVFYTVLLAGWFIIAWMLLASNYSLELMLNIMFGYMILVGGILPGPYLIWIGLKSENRAMKVKGIGGGIGVILCCLLADSLVLFVYMNVSFWTEFFMTIAPIVLISAVFYGRQLEKADLIRVAVPENAKI